MSFLVLALVCVLVNSYKIQVLPPKKVSITMQATTPEQHNDCTIERRLENEVAREMERLDDMNKVAVDPPEIKKLKELLDEFSRDDERWDVLVAIGDIYRKGAFPRFLPDEYIALSCYKTAAMSPDGDVAGIAQAKYIETRTESIDEQDKDGQPLPTIYGERACEIGYERVRTTPYSMFSSKPKIKKVTIPRVEQQPTTDFHTLFQANDAFGFDDHGFNFDINTFTTTNTAYRYDSQNVHDHSVVNTTKRNLEKMADTNHQRSKDVDGYISQIKLGILSNGGVTDKESSDALRVIESLSETKSSTFGVSEKEALLNAWNKIQDQKDTTLRKNLTENLTKQLASAVEHGHVVCSTGKITRIVSTFDGTNVDNMDSAKPLWAVKEELANMAAKIRDEKVESLTPTDKQSYERGTHPTLDEEMKKEFRRKAHDIYCNELKMNPSILEPIIKTYEEAF